MPGDVVLHSGAEEIMKKSLVAMAMTLALAASAHAQQNIDATLQKLVGDWAQDFTKTRPVPKPTPQSRVHHWKMNGSGKMTHWLTTTEADGKKTQTEMQTDDYSGKEYADNLPGQKSRFRVLDEFTIQQIRTGPDGQILRFLERSISPDGKTLTIKQVSTDGKGKGEHQIQVYHKQ
jgi:hypothetical protein